MQEKSSKDKSQAVFTIADILTCFDHKTEEMGINEIARRLGMYPSKIHRIVSALESTGLMEKNPHTNKYRIGLRLFETGILYSTHSYLRKIVRPHAVQLAKALQTNVNLAIRSRAVPFSAVIIDRVICLQTVHGVLRIAYNIPLHSSGVGKVLLAFSNDESIRANLPRMELREFTSSTITEKSRLQEEIKLIREQGYAIDRGETQSNVWCLASPIKNERGVIAALSVSDEAQRIQEKQEEIVRSLIKTTDFISYQLG